MYRCTQPCYLRTKWRKSFGIWYVIKLDNAFWPHPQDQSRLASCQNQLIACQSIYILTRYQAWKTFPFCTLSRTWNKLKDNTFTHYAEIVCMCSYSFEVVTYLQLKNNYTIFHMQKMICTNLICKYAHLTEFASHEILVKSWEEI